MADFKRNGYGQVEPNHLAGQKTGQIYAQLPAKSTITQLENGQFAKYDYPNGEVNFTGVGEWFMVFNEVHTYDERDRFYKDYVMAKADYVDGVMTPRLMRTYIGDIFTTNTIKTAGSKRTDVTIAADIDSTNAAQVAPGAIYQVNSDGFLEYTATASITSGEPQFQVVKFYTLADGQQAIKFQRVA